jgi:tRNA (cytidine/uridine-2'-O-)-methyltransferase
MTTEKIHRINVVLVAPEIPQNTGNIIRLCANTGAALHLVQPLGFDLTEPGLRRAALDYTDLTDLTVHPSFDAILKIVDRSRLYAATTEGAVSYHEVRYQDGDTIVFGSEHHGLLGDVLCEVIPTNRIRIPMKPSNRSMNLSNAVSVIVYEMWRQLGFEGQSMLSRNHDYFS